MKDQNMHQLRVFGTKLQALYFLPLPSTSCQWFLCFGTRPRHQTRAPWLGPPRLKKAKYAGSRIFDVSSSTGLRIEGYLTCWKDELGNHTLGTKAQNMHQLRVLGAKQQALYFLPLVPMLWHSAETPNPGTMAWSTQTHEG